MRTYFSLFLAACLAVVSFAACKKSSDSNNNNNNNPQPVTPPSNITALHITMNNLNRAAVPSGSNIYDAYIEIYGGNVLLAKSRPCNANNLPQTADFDGTYTFPYSFKEYDLKYYGVDYTTGNTYQLGTVHLALKDYSSDTYPMPTQMFFNSGGFAGTLQYEYSY